MVVVAVAAFLNKGFVAGPHCVIESHLFEGDFACLVKCVFLALFLLHGLKLSDRTKVAGSDVLVPALFDLLPLHFFHKACLFNADGTICTSKEILICCLI